MKKLNSKYNFAFLFITSIIMFFALSLSYAHAMTPTLSVTSNGDGDTVTVSVTGDSNSSVILYYYKNGVGSQFTPIGSTNSSGTFSTTISSSQYGITSNSIVHVSTGSVSGPQSANATWPTVTSLITSSNTLSLSQTGVVLTVGQNTTITANNIGTSSIYLYSNSNPQIANINISGSQVTIQANNYGTTTATLCMANNSLNCSSVYITVQNSGAQPLYFSQNSVTLSQGQSLSVQISGGSGYYTVQSNSSQNQALVQANISGSTLTLTTSSTSGSSSITVCSTDMTSCGIVNVTIGSSTSSSISFSQTSPTVVVGQSLNVSIYGPSSSLFYVSSNTNPSVVQANISGSTLTLLGITYGTSTVNVCSSASNCGTLNVTVNYNSDSGTKLTLSQDTVSLSIGQSFNITVSGGAMPYSISTDSSNKVSATLSGNI